MRHEESHVSDQDLLRAADGELSTRKIAEIQKHLAACWTCRARRGELEGAIARFVETHHRKLDSLLPPPDGARALLKVRMEELSAVSPPGSWRRLFSPVGDGLLVKLACAVLLFTGLLIFVLHPRWLTDEPPTPAAFEEARAIPDPRLTPGAALPVTKDDICAAGAVHTVRVVPEPVARRVFAAYGIHQPQPRAYELDYLITPALGGRDNIRNFWPQPYRTTVWNAHIKDALEDHLHRLVCAGDLDLATAQRDISQNWIAAYKKYFRTGEPLSEHSTFLKDRPWE
ncbi:MAG: hypothetical protein WD696_18425 [Bryobacteraceae bacterium]